MVWGYGGRMGSISYARHRFPKIVIQHAVWLYVRFGLSYRDVEDLLAERGLDVSCETIRQWVAKFGPAYAARLRSRRSRASPRWHLDEMFVRIGGRQMYLWRAVDDEGEVLDLLIQPRCDQKAARKPIRKLLKRHGFAPDEVVTDKLPSYAAAFRDTGLLDRHRTGGRLRTTGRRIRTCRSGDENGQRWDSDRRHRCSVSYPSMPTSTTTSTSSAI